MAEQTTTIIAPTSEVADGLDLYAVSELFKESDNLEDFEADLNNPDYGINNLDLDGNGQVDFIRVVEEIVGETHIIILQAIIWEDEFQDVATIEIETSGDTYVMHVQGDEVIYGANYYIAPTHVYINTWPIIAWISRPVYRPYRSVYYWNSYPRWWKPHRPLLIKNYHLRTNKYKKRNTFVVTRTARVKKVTRVKYKPRTSVRVTRHVGVKKADHQVKTKTTRKKVVVKQNSRPTKKTTVKKETTRTSNNKKTKTKSVKKKTTKKSKKSVRERN
ncbi:MAG: hypothetical protein OQK49_09455 [Proteobacteria bacterium]|nr:hypothetical protein [Pseudomonadota bacterium]